MTREIRRIEPLRFANVMAIVYAAIFLVFVALMTPYLLVYPMQGETGEALPRSFIFALFVGYPIVGTVMGWFGGLFLSAVYNFVAARMGGIRIEVSAEASSG